MIFHVPSLFPISVFFALLSTVHFFRIEIANKNEFAPHTLRYTRMYLCADIYTRRTIAKLPIDIIIIGLSATVI